MSVADKLTLLGVDVPERDKECVAEISARVAEIVESIDYALDTLANTAGRGE